MSIIYDYYIHFLATISWPSGVSEGRINRDRHAKIICATNGLRWIRDKDDDHRDDHGAVIHDCSDCEEDTKTSDGTRDRAAYVIK